MNINDALDIARRFILLRLYGAYATIKPLSASFNRETGIWDIRCAFKKIGDTKYSIVSMQIDDKKEDVASFVISAQG